MPFWRRLDQPVAACKPKEDSRFKATPRGALDRNKAHVPLFCSPSSGIFGRTAVPGAEHQVLLSGHEFLEASEILFQVVEGIGQQQCHWNPTKQCHWNRRTKAKHQNGVKRQSGKTAFFQEESNQNEEKCFDGSALQLLVISF